MANFFVFLICSIVSFTISTSFAHCKLSQSDNSKLISSSIHSWSGFEIKFEDNIPEKNQSRLYGALRVFIKKCDICDISGYSISVHYDEQNDEFDFHVHKLPEKSSPTTYV